MLDYRRVPIVTLPRFWDSDIWGMRHCDRFLRVMTCWRVWRRRDRNQRVSFALGDTPRAEKLQILLKFVEQDLNRNMRKPFGPPFKIWPNWVYANFAGWSLLRLWHTSTGELTGNSTAFFLTAGATIIMVNKICCIAHSIECLKSKNDQIRSNKRIRKSVLKYCCLPKLSNQGLFKIVLACCS